jgi:nucleoside-diphosphate-sugar epimerase
MNEIISITGATGYLGRSVAKRLIDSGKEVRLLGRNRSKIEDLISMGGTFVPLEISNLENVRKALVGSSTIIHCAALASPWGDYEIFSKTNILGTKNIIDYCLESKVDKLIYISTPSVYFDYKNRLSIKESDTLPIKQYSHYGDTKLKADELILKAFTEEKLPVISIRPRAIFGIGDETITPRILNAKLFGRTPLINSGLALHDFTYIDNVVDAISLCLNSDDRCLGEVFNISNDEPISTKVFFEKLLSAYSKNVSFINIPYFVLNPIVKTIELIFKIFKFEKEPKLTSYGIGLFANSQTLDISKAKEMLGYSPKVSLDEAMDIISKSN